MNIVPVLFLLLLPLASQPKEILDQAIKEYEDGEYRQAIHRLSSAGNSPEASAEVKFWLGRSYLRVRELDKAVEEMGKAVELEPANARYHLWLGRAYGERADKNNSFGDARKLLKEFQKACELSPEDIDIRFDLLEFYIQAPWIVGGSKKKAEAEADAIAKLNPKLGYTAQAVIYERKQEWDKAEKEYKKATLKYPDDADAHKDLALFLFSREKYQGALESARQVLGLNAESKQGLFIEAASGIFLGRNLEKAAESLKRLAAGPRRDDDPALEDVYYWQGLLHYRKGERKESREAFSKALEIRPGYEKAEQYLKKLR